jgi:hypothetical protein
MMAASWAENTTTGFLYTAPFLADLFAYPGASLELAPTMYREAEPVAFVAGFPRRIRFHDRKLHVLVVALLTVSSAYKSAGYGILVWSELVRRARNAGFDGMVNYCVEGEAMERMIEGSCLRLGIPVARIHSAHYLSRVLLGAGLTDVDGMSEVSADELVAAASTVPGRVPLARAWSAPEAAWQCSRTGVVSARLGRGVVTGYVMPLANADRTSCLVVEDVLWDELGADDRTKLAAELVAKGAAAGARIAVLADVGYADVSPFVAIKFRPSGRTIHAYLSLWDEPRPPAAVSGYYLDLF